MFSKLIWIILIDYMMVIKTFRWLPQEKEFTTKPWEKQQELLEQVRVKRQYILVKMSIPSVANEKNIPFTT